MPALTDVPESDEPAHPKPMFRGRLHQFAVIGATPAAIVLVAAARPALARAAVTVYGLSLIALFGTSALYHRISWTARALARMRRLDHSMIYVLIAGTYTPFSLLVLKGPWSVVMLSLVLTGAVAGILIKILALDRLHIVGSALYIVLGWLVLLAAPQMVHRLHAAELVPLVVGGVLYTVGAIVLVANRPNPNPRVFGYHEVFHLSTVLAGICHYVAVLQVVLALH